MSFAQPNLFGDDQSDLFGKVKLAPAIHEVNPQHIRNRFIDFLAQMRSAQTWPWDENHVETLRERTWPYLYAKLPDQLEAADWKAQIETEVTRLDLMK